MAELRNLSDSYTHTREKSPTPLKGYSLMRPLYPLDMLLRNHNLKPSHFLETNLFALGGSPTFPELLETHLPLWTKKIYILSPKHFLHAANM